MDISKWNSDQDTVYTHVKQRKGHYVHLTFAIVINRFFSDEIDHAFRIYYRFELFNETTNQPCKIIEDMLENTSPKVTRNDYYCDMFGRLHRFGGKVEFIEY